MTEKSVVVLTLIAEGFGYSQIVDGHPDITYRDIFAAAEEALQLNGPTPDYHRRLAMIKARFPRAYEKWTLREDAELKAMCAGGASHERMSSHFQRQLSAIRSRLLKLAAPPDAFPEAT